MSYCANCNGSGEINPGEPCLKCGDGELINLLSASDLYLANSTFQIRRLLTELLSRRRATAQDDDDSVEHAAECDSRFHPGCPKCEVHPSADEKASAWAMDNGTVVWGASDDLIEVSGAVRGEVNGSASTITMSDGTVLKVKYGKPHNGSLWQITLMVKGPLFDWIENSYVERDHYKVIDGKKERDLGAYSDVAHFKTGITSASHRGKVFTRIP